MFSRTQALTLVVGAANLALGVMQVLPVTAAQHCVQAVVGMFGIMLARRHHTARLYGMILLFGFGGLFAWQLGRTGDVGGWLPLRMTLSGMVIVLVPRAEQRFAALRDHRDDG
ncbi:hypothetical protein B0I33_111212 [Prauserella shujinwangii]|uniref:Uncharacterized protein n=1 Tax=Prauserella shujinwangii TaxID=1453103 RepID=A0A2T0LNC6_9PSEU|nr:DUF4383 domain-containing protein [Prauserella shujinwangii]PRX44698.1 hypothetical protein B0I33_111212 [Prauserella shujinwangii]